MVRKEKKKLQKTCKRLSLSFLADGSSENKTPGEIKR